MLPPTIDTLSHRLPILTFLLVALLGNHLLYVFALDSVPPTDFNLLSVADGRADFKCEPEYFGLGRSITGRADGDSQTLQNNVPGNSTISQGQTQQWVFPKAQLNSVPSSAQAVLPPSIDRRNSEENSKLELKRRQSSARYYLTLNVCQQPSPTSANPTRPPDPLHLYISTTASNTRPGPNVPGQSDLPADGGYAEYDSLTTGDTYFAVTAPLTSGFSGDYLYEITVSVDAPYSDYQDYQSLFYVDSDDKAGLLVTNNLTIANASVALQEEWMDILSPFSIFVHYQNDTQIAGLKRSWCGLKNSAQVKGIRSTEPSNVNVSMTEIGGGYPKQQFYVSGLNKSSSYYAIMALETNYTTAGPGNKGGGGVVWKDISFNTTSDGNCQVIYGLEFCDTIAYAVPSNPNNFGDMRSLANHYDQNTSAIYQAFAYSVEQIPCETTSDAQYSLAVTCKDCENAYKQWLCAVTIPRCKDFSSTDSFLVPRNIAQNFINKTTPSVALGGLAFSDANKSISYMAASRNPLIFSDIQPGPYKELLPCQGLCYSLVQSCPASLQFACPLSGKGLEQSYGSVALSGVPGGVMTCSEPGAIWMVNGGSGLRPSFIGILVVFSMVIGSGVLSA